MTQSAVSKRIAQLEEQLAVRLFDRIGRQVNLTEAGTTLLPLAEKILAEFEDARRQLSNLSGEISGRLSVGASHHISLHRLPNTLKAFNQRFPDVELDLRFYESEVAYEAVVRGDIELALITLSPESDSRIRSEVLWIDKLYYTVAAEHPLTKKSKPTLETINSYPGILPAPDTFTTRIVQHQLAQQGLTPRINISTNYLDTIRMMVRVGLGWSVLPETLINDDLVILNPNQPAIERPLGYIYHRDRTLSNAARELVAMLKIDAGFAS